MIVGIGGENELCLCLLLEKIEHAWADIEKGIDRCIAEMIAGLVLEIDTRRLAVVRHSGFAGMLVTRNPEHAAGKSGGASEILIFLDDDYVEPRFPGRDRRRQAAGARAHDQHVARQITLLS